ncbi:FkbM family methyltransferase [uncultured Maritimibacter sp.]|jgi:FkbM family methyltransferase|uniref:FkbM family methyltransferase n=1 Tax=uncultured Maritimibacter sp. TaxID=991866 RepID=UPI000A57AF6D|nr:FkbM family methyltransferase [uncultured Maritimibacter sp.]
MSIRNTVNRLIKGKPQARQKPPERPDPTRKAVKTRLYGWRPEFLAELGPVGTVIDIGVLNGTPQLYAAFPDAYLILIEALPPYREKVESLVAERPGEVHMVAAGSTETTMQINLLNDVPARSSLLTHVKGGSDDVTRYDVPVKPLDTLFAGRDFDGDVLLKIDTEGFDLEVLKGASETLRKVKWVITETSIALRHENSYRFADIAFIMRENGFEVFDIMTVTRSGFMIPGASIADTIWVRKDLLDRW